MSVLVCGGKLTYPIKYNTDRQGVEGVQYVENLEGYLPYNKGIERVVYLETIDNEFKVEYFEGYKGDIVLYTSKVEEREKMKEDLDKLVEVKGIEGLRVSEIQWVIMTS